jgi:AbrB family looped-hinge helix DNA binding protein
MSTATISDKGWIVIPKAYRLKYNLKPGDQVRIVDYGGGLSIVPLPEEPITALRGMLAGGPSLTADLLAERQQARKGGENKLNL